MVCETPNQPKRRSDQIDATTQPPRDGRIAEIAFDDHHLVANAGPILPCHLGTASGPARNCVDQHLDLGRAPGGANTGDKIMTLVASALAGGDCIDDADVFRAGRTARVLGCTVKAPSTLGTFAAQSPVGPRPPTGSGEPGPLLVTSLGRGGGTPIFEQSRVVDHRPGLHHL